MGKSRAGIANSLRLLSLSSEIQGFLTSLDLDWAKVLLSLEDEQRKLLARQIIESGMSVREAEAQVRSLKENRTSGSVAGSSGTRSSEAEQMAIRDLERRIGDHFNTRVSLKHGAKKGKLTIEYFGNDDLDRILEKLGVAS